MSKFSTVYPIAFILFYTTTYVCAADKRISPSEYIQAYKYEAINEMLEYGIPASITIAQGMLESDCGNSPLAINAKNHFGIKCHIEWTGLTYYQDDDKKDECFRVYSDAKESYRDHSVFLKDRLRYAALFQLPVSDYKGWAYGLKKAGYATNPAYPEKLIKIIEENQLYKFDQIKNVKALKHVKTKENIESKSFETLLLSHQVFINNKIKYVVAQKGDSYFSIAKEFDVDLRLLYHYNDLHKTNELAIGQYLYLEPKRIKSESKFYTVKPNDTMYIISQLYGIKLKKLYRKNNMKLGSEPNVGDILSLQKKLRK